MFKYTALDLADWLDEKLREHQAQQDEWLIQAHGLSDVHPVIVFNTWMQDRIQKWPQTVSLLFGGSLIDVLRFGSDMEMSSAWGVTKGVFANVFRLLVVLGPAASGVRAGGAAASRYAGLLATSEVGTLAGVSGPCRFVSVNNVISAVKGKTVQLFVSLDDVVAVRSSVTPGTRGYIGELLEHQLVAPLISKAGVVWTNLGNLRSLDDVIAAAKRHDGAISVGLQWTNTAGRAMAHRIVMMKDHAGQVRYLDYSTGNGFMGYTSLRDMAARGAKWSGIERATVRPEVVLFQSKYVKFIQDVNNVWHLSFPVAVGFAWGRGKTFDEVALEIAMSLWTFIKEKLGDGAPPPPISEAAPPRAVPRPPAHTRPPEAANAPRADWLPGVRYRLKYLAYYDGPVLGLPFDQKTKEAVLAFQTDQQIMIDGIPGPQTQGELVKVCGF